MPLVARLKSGVRIEQYYRDHNPPHFHAIHQDAEALIEIAWPINVYAASLTPRLMNEVRDWARTNRAALALNWFDALAPATDTEGAVTTLRTIRAVTANPGYQLDVTWADGTHSLVDMSGTISTAGVFAPLADVSVFKSVRVGDRARTIEWHLGSHDARVDIDADALFAISRTMNAPREEVSASG